MIRSLEPPSPRLRELFEQERAREQLSPDHLARLRAGITGRVGVPTNTPPSDGTSAAPSASSPVAPSSLPLAKALMLVLGGVIAGGTRGVFVGMSLGPQEEDHAERAAVEAPRSSSAIPTETHSAAPEPDALRRHAALYPDGTLIEEREGLEVLLLARSDRALAGPAAERFHRRYPDSVLWPAIERVLNEVRE